MFISSAPGANVRDREKMLNCLGKVRLDEVYLVVKSTAKIYLYLRGSLKGIYTKIHESALLFQWNVHKLF